MSQRFIFEVVVNDKTIEEYDINGQETTFDSVDVANATYLGLGRTRTNGFDLDFHYGFVVKTGIFVLTDEIYGVRHVAVESNGIMLSGRPEVTYMPFQKKDGETLLLVNRDSTLSQAQRCLSNTIGWTATIDGKVWQAKITLDAVNAEVDWSMRRASRPPVAKIEVSSLN